MVGKLEFEQGWGCRKATGEAGWRGEVRISTVTSKLVAVGSPTKNTLLMEALRQEELSHCTHCKGGMPMLANFTRWRPSLPAARCRAFVARASLKTLCRVVGF